MHQLDGAFLKLHLRAAQLQHLALKYQFLPRAFFQSFCACGAIGHRGFPQALFASADVLDQREGPTYAR